MKNAEGNNPTFFEIISKNEFFIFWNFLCLCWSLWVEKGVGVCVGVGVGCVGVGVGVGVGVW